MSYSAIRSFNVSPWDTAAQKLQGHAADMRFVPNDETIPEIRLHSFTYADRADLLPALTVALDAAGAWVLQQKTLSATALELHVEVQLRALPHLYGALLGSGLELTRNGHRALAERCNCILHMRGRRGQCNILALRLEVKFLLDPPGTLDLSRLALATAAA